MKIMLVDPPARSDDYDKAYPNLGLLQLISYLRTHTRLADDDIIFLDQFHTIEDHIRTVKQVRPAVYGISFAFLPQRIAYETINVIKERFPEVLVIAGGPHPSAAPRDVLEKSRADLVAIGEGETLLAEIVDKLLTGNRDFRDTPGVMLRENGGIRGTAPRPVIEDIDTLPYLAWDRIDFAKFSGQHYCKSDRQACIVVSRGCPFRCTFCSLPVWRVSKPYVRLRSPENIAGEVDWLYRLGVREIKMVSDELNINCSWAKDVCRAVIALGHEDLYFQSNLRAWPIDEELVRLFRSMNMWLVHLGCESANDRVLEGIQKRATVRQVEDCVALLARHNVRTLLFMMAFNLWEQDGQLQWETPGEALNSLVWAWKQFARRRVAYMTWSIATPMPGAALYDIAERHGLDPAGQILRSWDHNKDYPGINLQAVGISEFVRLGLMRLGIVSKACFALASGGFDWGRNFYRVGILLRSFLGNRRPGCWRPPRPAVSNKPLQPEVEA